MVGASQAGLQVAVSLRERGYREPITLVGAEVHPPYARPPLTKAFLAGDAPAASLPFRTADFYREHDLDLLLGQRVTSADLAGGMALAADGTRLPFDRLVLTTGARPRRLQVPGADLPGVLHLRTLDDAAALAVALRSAGSVVVVGGGFIGLEAAAVCRALGKTVTVVEVAERLMARAVAPVVSTFFRAAHERRGTAVLLDRGVAAIEGDHGRVTAVRLDDGTTVAADVVLVGIGVQPRVELARDLGLDIEDGAIVVDRCSRSSDPRVVAAGDCTTTREPGTDGAPVHLESVQNAVDQAKAAAAAVLGVEAPCTAVPWFWSDQDTLKLQIAGLSQGYDDVVVRGDPAEERFSALYYRQGRLIAVDAVNRPADYMVVRHALARGATVPPDRAADASTSLKQLVELPSAPPTAETP